MITLDYQNLLKVNALHGLDQKIFDVPASKIKDLLKKIENIKENKIKIITNKEIKDQAREIIALKKENELLKKNKCNTTNNITINNNNTQNNLIIINNFDKKNLTQ